MLVSLYIDCDEKIVGGRKIWIELNSFPKRGLGCRRILLYHIASAVDEISSGGLRVFLQECIRPLMHSGKRPGFKVEIRQLIDRDHIFWIKLERLFQCFARFIVLLLFLQNYSQNQMRLRILRRFLYLLAN